MIDKALINIGGNVWVDIMSITVVQPRILDGDPLKKVPGCVVFLTGDNEPVYGEDDPTDVIATINAANR